MKNIQNSKLKTIMKKLNKIVSGFCLAMLGLLMLTGCEGNELYKVGSPSWLDGKLDSIANSKTPEVGLYSIGTTSLNAPFWTLGKSHVVPAGGTLEMIIDLTVNPDNKYFKNFYAVITNDVSVNPRGGGYYEYGVMRFDNDRTKNSEWGDIFKDEDRDNYISANFTNTSESDEIDATVQDMNGLVKVTVDRSNGGLTIKYEGEKFTKTYSRPNLENKNIEATNENIRITLGVEGSFVNVIESNIDPVDDNKDYEPVSMTLKAPKKVKTGTPLNDIISAISAEVDFGEGGIKTVTGDKLSINVIPDMNSVGKKTLVAAYNKTSKGEAAKKAVVSSVQLDVVDKMYTCIGKTDNTSGFREEATENFKVAPGQTYVNYFTNYTDGVNNWDNFIIQLCKADGTEYCFVRADNWGLGGSYWDGCQSCDWNWNNFKEILNGAKVTTYITNNGDGTADIKAVVVGSDGKTYTQKYTGLKNIDANDMCFNLSMEKGHLEFDYVIGAEDNTSGFRAIATPNIKIEAGQTFVNRFINAGDGATNWNNFIIQLCKGDGTEYCFVRADNWGLGGSYWDGCQSCDYNWDIFATIMDGAKVTTYITNNGDGTADIKAVVEATDGKVYTQNYKGLNNIDSNDLYYNLSMEKAHLVFE